MNKQYVFNISRTLAMNSFNATNQRQMRKCFVKTPINCTLIAILHSTAILKTVWHSYKRSNFLRKTSVRYMDLASSTSDFMITYFAIFQLGNIKLLPLGTPLRLIIQSNWIKIVTESKISQLIPHRSFYFAQQPPTI